VNRRERRGIIPLLLNCGCYRGGSRIPPKTISSGYDFYDNYGNTYGT
jgi:hypothetical protein